MNNIRTDFIELAKSIINAAYMTDAHITIADIVNDASAIMNAAIKYSKQHSESIDAPSPEAIKRIKQFAREYDIDNIQKTLYKRLISESDNMQSNSDQRELSETEVKLLNICRTTDHGYTIIHHKPGGLKDWITLTHDELTKKANASVNEIWDRIFE